MNRDRIIVLLLILLFFLTAFMQVVTHRFIPNFNDYYIGTFTAIDVYITTSLNSTYITSSTVTMYDPIFDAGRTSYSGFIKLILLLLLLFTTLIIFYHRRNVSQDEF